MSNTCILRDGLATISVVLKSTAAGQKTLKAAQQKSADSKFLERQVKSMKLSKRDWIINIENVASKVASEYGQAVVDSVFRRYGAHNLNDLASCYYSEVFSDLEMIAND